MKKILLALAAVLAIGGVGVGAFFLGKSAGQEETAAAPAPAETPAAPAEPAVPAAPLAPDAVPAPVAPRRVDEARKPADWPAFSIELASFRDVGLAREYAEEMARRGLSTELVETIDAGGRSWYRIRVGRYDDPRQAAAQLPQVERVAGISGIVTTEIAQAAPAAVAQ